MAARHAVVAPWNSAAHPTAREAIDEARVPQDEPEMTPVERMWPGLWALLRRVALAGSSTTRGQPKIDHSDIALCVEQTTSCMHIAMNHTAGM
jgi:hypothetical protein